MQRRAGHGLQFLKCHRRQFFAQHETAVHHVDHRMAGIDAGDAADAGQRERAFLNQLRFAVLGNMKLRPICGTSDKNDSCRYTLLSSKLLALA